MYVHYVFVALQGPYQMFSILADVALIRKFVCVFCFFSYGEGGYDHSE